MKKHGLNASFTIEMSFLIPLILFVFMEIVLCMFYFHDKNVLNSAAYEAAVVGSSKSRTKEGISEEELNAFLKERIRGKCILFSSCQMSTSIQEEEVLVEIHARKSGYTIAIEKKAKLTEPEERIRDRRRLDIKNGETNND